MTPD
ncbi:hypothetical protein ECEC1869_2962, partial [Escherichia coli EC1869]